MAPKKIGVPETILKLFRKYLNSIAGEHVIRQLQKIAILGTAQFIRKVLM